MHLSTFLAKTMQCADRIYKTTCMLDKTQQIYLYFKHIETTDLLMVHTLTTEEILELMRYLMK